MVNFADAITGVKVAGKRAELPNPSQVRRILVDTLSTPKPELTIAERMRTEINVVDNKAMSVDELIGRYRAQLDGKGGEWAPWSPVARMMK